MKKLILLFILLFSIQLQAQNFLIGHRSETITDVSRNDRQIPIEVYYPAIVTGDDAQFATGTFPIVSFGHGFAMGVDLYTNITDYFVPKGYIFLMVNTETSLLSPSHPDLALDLNFAIADFNLKNTNNSSPYFGKLNGKNGLMGHSMGGGAAVLAASNNLSANALILMAPAETTPSSIVAAAQVTAPSIVFSGEGDAVTVPSDTHNPIYTQLLSDCKFFVTINGGGHCYFANSAPFTCDFGETFSGSTLSITREQQQDVFFDFALPVMEINLKQNSTTWNAFRDSISFSLRVSSTSACPIDFVGIQENPIFTFQVFPQPASDNFQVSINNGNTSTKGKWKLYNTMGQIVKNETDFTSHQFSVSCLEVSSGIYFLEVIMEGKSSFKKISIR